MPIQSHQNDKGTNIIVTIQDDAGVVSLAAATIVFTFTKPNGDKITKTGSLYTDGTDGKTNYILTSGDLDQSGTWKLQLFVTIGTSSWYTNIYTFPVNRNL